MGHLKRLHGLGAQAGLDHDALHDLAAQRYRVNSLARLTAAQLADFELHLSGPPPATGRSVLAPQAAQNRSRTLRPESHVAAGAALGRPTQGEKNWLWVHFEILKQHANWTRKSLSRFIWKQTGGRAASIDTITRSELNAVLHALRSIIHQKGITPPVYTGRPRRGAAAATCRSGLAPSQRREKAGAPPPPPSNVVHVDFGRETRSEPNRKVRR